MKPYFFYTFIVWVFLLSPWSIRSYFAYAGSSTNPTVTNQISLSGQVEVEAIQQAKFLLLSDSELQIRRAKLILLDNILHRDALYIYVCSQDQLLWNKNRQDALSEISAALENYLAHVPGDCAIKTLQCLFKIENHLISPQEAAGQIHGLLEELNRHSLRESKEDQSQNAELNDLAFVLEYLQHQVDQTSPFADFSPDHLETLAEKHFAEKDHPARSESLSFANFARHFKSVKLARELNSKGIGFPFGRLLVDEVLKSGGYMENEARGLLGMMQMRGIGSPLDLESARKNLQLSLKKPNPEFLGLYFQVPKAIPLPQLSIQFPGRTREFSQRKRHRGDPETDVNTTDLDEQ